MAIKKYKLVKRMSPYQEESVFTQHFVGFGDPCDCGEHEAHACACEEPEEDERGGVNMTLEFQGRQFPVEDIAQKAVESWLDAGHDEDELEHMDIYVKPEEKAAYYVANGADNGKVDL